MILRSLTLSLVLLLHGAAASGQCSDPLVQRSLFEESADFTSDPVPQIQAHFARVIDRLESADVSELTVTARRNRREMIADLADYSAAAVFPQNHRQGTPTPIFIDDDGRACAVGHLMIESGARELARRICAQSNLAYVPEITVTGTLEWMDSVGLSLQECAWIQPAYGCQPFGGDMTVGPSICMPQVPNSAGSFATLRSCGTNLTADNRVFLFVEEIPMNSVGIFLSAQAADALGQPGSSQGTVCLSGAIGRFDTQVFSALDPTLSPFSGAGYWSGIPVDILQMPTPVGAVSVLPGDTWYFQAWYRDANPEPTSNFTDVISITFS